MATPSKRAVVLLTVLLAFGPWAALAEAPPGEEVWSNPANDFVILGGDVVQVVLAKDVPGPYQVVVPEGDSRGTWTIQVLMRSATALDGSATYNAVPLSFQTLDISFESLVPEIGHGAYVAEVNGEIAIITELGSDAPEELAFFREGEPEVMMRPGLFIDCAVLPGGLLKVCYTYMERLDGEQRVILKIWVFYDGSWHLVWLGDTDWVDPNQVRPMHEKLPATLPEALAVMRQEIAWRSGDDWPGLEIVDSWSTDPRIAALSGW